MAIKKKVNATAITTIGLYCQKASVAVPAVFRIAIYDSDDCLLMNRSCYYTFSGSNSCGFVLENWIELKRRIRSQKRPMLAYLMIDIPKDQQFMSIPCFPGSPSTTTHEDLLKTLRSEFEKIEANEPMPFSDVKIVVAGNSGTQEFHCHRHVLCARSAVFSRMLEKTDFRESCQGVIDVSDDEFLDRQTMIAVLRFLYCGEVGEAYEGLKMDLDAVVRLLNAAEKYELNGLKFWCHVCMIVGCDTDEQRRRQLPVAELFNLNQLKAICVAQLSNDPVMIDQNLYETETLDAEIMADVMKEWVRKNGTIKVEIK